MTLGGCDDCGHVVELDAVEMRFESPVCPKCRSVFERDPSASAPAPRLSHCRIKEPAGCTVELSKKTISHNGTYREVDRADVTMCVEWTPPAPSAANEVLKVLTGVAGIGVALAIVAKNGAPASLIGVALLGATCIFCLGLVLFNVGQIRRKGSGSILVEDDALRVASTRSAVVEPIAIDPEMQARVRFVPFKRGGGMFEVQVRPTGGKWKALVYFGEDRDDLEIALFVRQCVADAIDALVPSEEAPDSEPAVPSTA